MCEPTVSCLTVDSFRPSFSKLAEWLDNLLMHMDIGLNLLSELDQLCKTFWQNRNNQSLINKESPKPPVENTDNNQNGERSPQERLSAQEDTGYSYPDGECTGFLLDQRQNSCSSTRIGLGTETHDNRNTSGQTQIEVSEPRAGQANRPRIICTALWDKSTEDFP